MKLLSTKSKVIIESSSTQFIGNIDEQVKFLMNFIHVTSKGQFVVTINVKGMDTFSNNFEVNVIVELIIENQENLTSIDLHGLLCHAAIYGQEELNKELKTREIKTADKDFIRDIILPTSDLDEINSVLTKAYNQN